MPDFMLKDSKCSKIEFDAELKAVMVDFPCKSHQELSKTKFSVPFLDFKQYQTVRVRTGLEVPCEAFYLS